MKHFLSVNRDKKQNRIYGDDILKRLFSEKDIDRV